MQLGREIGMKPLKFTNHETNKELDDWIYSANDVLYAASCRYISNSLKEDIMKDLQEVGKQASGTTYEGKVEQRRIELVNGLRTAFKSLRNYNSDDNEEQSQKSINYHLSKAIKQKQEMTAHQIVDWIKELKDMKRYYPKAKNWNSVDKMKQELYERLTAELEIN